MGESPFPPSPLPPPLFWRPNLQFFNEINDLKYVSFSCPLLKFNRTDLQEPFGEKKNFFAAADTSSNLPFCFRFSVFLFPHFSRLMKVHELRHGILQALPQAKPPYGGARCPRIAYNCRHIICALSVAIAIVVVVRRRLFFAHSTLPSRIAPSRFNYSFCSLYSKNTTFDDAPFPAATVTGPGPPCFSTPAAHQSRPPLSFT